MGKSIVYLVPEWKNLADICSQKNLGHHRFSYALKEAFRIKISLMDNPAP